MVHEDTRCDLAILMDMSNEGRFEKESELRMKGKRGMGLVLGIVLVLGGGFCPLMAQTAPKAVNPSQEQDSESQNSKTEKKASPSPPASELQSQLIRGVPMVRLDDLVDFEGVRDNFLVGQGIVTGLQGTGDSTEATRQALSNLVTKLKLNVSPNEVDIGNVALVTVTTRLPPFKGPGAKLDVSVQSVGGASSLFGGTLLLAPLYGPDGEVYAIAQGPLTIGGFSVGGEAASVTQNHPTVGRVPGGARVEKRVDFPEDWPRGELELYLREQSFVTATRVVRGLENLFPGTARSINAGTIGLTIPEERKEDVVGFLAQVCAVRVQPHLKARVVIQERTGTIVAGRGVTLSSVAITHGNLTVTVNESPIASQPAPFSEGTTEVLPRTDIEASIEDRAMTTLPDTVTLADLAEALNALGATPRDMITILQLLHAHGALNAELVLL